MTHNSRTNSKGRVHGSKHNDRNFDVDQVDNIDKTRMDQNFYWNCYNNSKLTFEEVELKYYKRFFSKQLQETNEKYITNRHPERCKTMEQFIKLRQYCPEETVIQIGKMEQHIDLNTLKRAYIDYFNRMADWTTERGRPFQILNFAVHADEAVPHIQQRRVWQYTDENGILRVGQEKALEQAGVPLPDPDKPEGRRNNRKMTFDKMAREMWFEVCKEYGIKVEREPVPNGKHNREKEDMIRDKYNEIIADIENKEIEKEKLETSIKDLQKQKDQLDAEIEDLQKEEETINAVIKRSEDRLERTLGWEGTHKALAEERTKRQKEERLSLLERFYDFCQQFFPSIIDRFMQHERESRSKKKMLNQDGPPL